MVVEDRHAVGEHVIEARHRRGRKQLRPLAALRLHADEHRLPGQRLQEGVDAGVVGDREAEAAIGRDAVVEAGLEHVLDDLLHRQPALEVGVEIHQRVIGGAQPDKLLVRRVEFRRAGGVVRQFVGQQLHADVLKRHLAPRPVPLQGKGAVP